MQSYPDPAGTEVGPGIGQLRGNGAFEAFHMARKYGREKDRNRQERRESGTRYRVR